MCAPAKAAIRVLAIGEDAMVLFLSVLIIVYGIVGDVPGIPLKLEFF